MSKKIFNNKNLVFIVVPILLTITLIIHFDIQDTSNKLAISLINRSIKRTKTELKYYLSPVASNILSYKQKLTANYNSNITLDEFNKEFIPVINNIPLISSIIYAKSTGEEIMLLKKDSIWQNRIITIDTNGKEILKNYYWKYDYDLNKKNITLPFNNNNNKYLYSLKKRAWYKEAVYNADSLPVWTNPYKFFTTGEPGITASIKWKSNDSITNILAFDVLLESISKYTSNTKIAKNGIILITSVNGKVVGLPRNPKFKNKNDFLKYSLVSVDSLGLPEISAAKKAWKKKKEPSIFKFRYLDDNWWCGINKFIVKKQKIFYIIILVPESDFLMEFNYTRIFISISFLIVLILTIIILRAYKQQQTLNSNLNNKNIELKHLHKELNQSINYSVNIQKAMLPDKNVLNNYFSESFIFYQPKDKISGDFYWWHEINNKIIVVAADCTGHGVPGALLSMIGISSLKTIIDKNISEPANILSLLRMYIINRLNQKNDIGVNKDGIDMSIITYNKNKIVFAGANNPIYIIKNIKLEVNHSKIIEYSNNDSSLFLYEIKPDKMPIAISDKLLDFNQIEVSINKGDIIYMFSDGFIDQFGGETTYGKKYLSKRFRQYLLKISSSPLNIQKELLLDEFKNWKGNREQIDDVLIIGLKI